jgi:hypothetical protein
MYTLYCKKVQAVYGIFFHNLQCHPNFIFPLICIFFQYIQMFFLTVLNFICRSCNQSFSRILFISLALMCVVCCSVIVDVLRTLLPCFPIILTFMH